MPPSLLARFAPWPLPALLAWAVGWATALASRQHGAQAGLDLVLGTAAAAALAWLNAGQLRRWIAVLGFPVSALLLAAASGGLAAWAWLLALLPLVLLYPLRAWRDAPFFPTPAAALLGLDAVVKPAPRHVLDAGCGLGHGLVALQRLWPGAALRGVEWSAPMAWWASRRVPAAQVKRGDMWAQSWADLDLVYLFQRPETMARAWAKANAEMAPGAWFASLEFPVPGTVPHATLDAGVGRPVYVYRVQGMGRGAATGSSAGSTADSIADASGR